MTWRQMNPWRSDRVDLGFQRRSVPPGEVPGEGAGQGTGVCESEEEWSMAVRGEFSVFWGVKGSILPSSLFYSYIPVSPA